MATNLLAETVAMLTENGKAPGDVVWVGNAKYSGSWSEFAALADFAYDAGFGAEYIPIDLRVVGDDWWLERHEYDGSEWWEFKTVPTKPTRFLPLNFHAVGNGESHPWAWERDDEELPPEVDTGLAPTLA